MASAAKPTVALHPVSLDFKLFSMSLTPLRLKKKPNCAILHRSTVGLKVAKSNVQRTRSEEPGIGADIAHAFTGCLSSSAAAAGSGIALAPARLAVVGTENDDLPARHQPRCAARCVCRHELCRADLLCRLISVAGWHDAGLARFADRPSCLAGYQIARAARPGACA